MNRACTVREERHPREGGTEGMREREGDRKGVREGGEGLRE